MERGSGVHQRRQPRPAKVLSCSLPGAYLSANVEIIPKPNIFDAPYLSIERRGFAIVDCILLLRSHVIKIVLAGGGLIEFFATGAESIS
jgi:hypothetical protein